MSLPYRVGNSPLNLLFDSTGIKAVGEVGWNARNLSKTASDKSTLVIADIRSYWISGRNPHSFNSVRAAHHQPMLPEGLPAPPPISLTLLLSSPL